MVIDLIGDEARSSVSRSYTIDKAKAPLIRNPNLHLNRELQRMYATGYYGPKVEIKDLQRGSGWFAPHYAHHKFDQLAYLRHFWPWRVIVAFFAITIVINVLIVLSLTNRNSSKTISASGKFIPLNDFQKRTLANFKLRRPLLSIDINNNLLILSSSENRTDELSVMQLALDSSHVGFASEKVILESGMRNCQQLSSFVHCCVITAVDDAPVDKGTHCFRQHFKRNRGRDFQPLPIINQVDERHNSTSGPRGLFDHFYDKNTQMIHTWQTLSNDETVVLLQSMTGEYSILDAKDGTSMPILEDEGNANLKPVAYFFGMDNAKELTELAQGEYTFHICEYLRDSGHRFLLQDCYETPLIKLRDFPHVKFCANPIYQAVIQFTDEYINMKWQLQVTYTTTNGTTDDNIYTVDSVDFVPNQQIAMVCSPFNIDIYMVSNGVLVHYAIDLPKSDGETLIGNYF